MITFKEKVLANVDVKELMYFLTLAGLAILVPSLLHVQWITGSIVNAILILALFLLGLKRALVIAFVPSLIALSAGLLPAMLAIAIPFIIISNIIYVLFVNYIYRRIQSKEKSFWMGIFFGSGFKFAFLLLSASFIIKLFASGSVVLKIGQMMTWTQFATAITGGMIAWIVLKRLNKI